MREMGSFDRSKKRIQLWKKAALHFSLCFVMGFFTGFAPTSTTSLLSGQANPYQSVKNLGISAKPTEALQMTVDERGSLNRSLMTSETIPSSQQQKPPLPLADEEDDDGEEFNRELVIIITTTTTTTKKKTSAGDGLQEALLRRLANTLRLVSPPLLWIVVEARADAPRTAETLRRTGIMYRHLTYAENFTDPGGAAEADHQRNVALNHIEFHRLNGIVHFADVSNVYDLEFFEDIREIETFGAWPVATASANRRRVVVEGPVCSSFKVVGWQSKDLNDIATTAPNNGVKRRSETNIPKPSKINISGFAFNSSILWDPERWGRSTSLSDTSQDSVKFVQEVVLEDETKLRAIPPDCSKIMLWHLHIPNDLLSLP